MSWDSQLSSILSVADGSVAKMRERLNSLKLTKGGEDVFPVRKKIHDFVSGPDALTPGAPLPWQSHSPVSSPSMQWSDLAAVQSQLNIQNQAINSLTRKIQNMEREQQSQQYLIQALQDEIHRLHKEQREMERQKDMLKRGQSPWLERRMEHWRTEVGQELSSMQGQISRATSLGLQEGSFRSNLHWQEVEHLRKEVEEIKIQLRRQEEDMRLKQAENKETRRQYEHSCKTLQELTDRYRVHSSDLAKAVSQYSRTQREVCNISATVSELKDEVRRLDLKECESTPLQSAHTAGAPTVLLPHSRSSLFKVVEEPHSDSVDSSPTPSLAEISSDDLSWLDDKDPNLHDKQRVGISVHPRWNKVAGQGTDLEEEEDDDDLYPDIGSDLSINDL